MHICVSKITIIVSDNGLSAPSHYLNQCWNIVNWALRNKLQWDLYRNSNIFIQGNAFESVVCEMAGILSRPQCINKLAKCRQSLFAYSEVLRIWRRSYWNTIVWVIYLTGDPKAQHFAISFCLYSSEFFSFCRLDVDIIIVAWGEIFMKLSTIT